MHMLALVLALSIGSTPASTPASPTPAQEARAATPTFELPFSAVPPTMPDPSAWTGSQTEGVITHTDIPRALAEADAVTKWLVAQKVCAAEVMVCRFLLHFQMVDDEPAAEVSNVAVRFVFRGPKSVIVEGYTLARGKDTATYHLFRRAGDTWTELAGDDRQAEYDMLGNLVGLVNALARGRMLNLIRQ